MVRVLFYATIRELTGEKETALPFSGTISELVKRLEQQYGCTFAAEAENGSGSPLDQLIVMVNGRHIAHIGGPDASVKDGDLVMLFPIVGGG